MSRIICTTLAAALVAGTAFAALAPSAQAQTAINDAQIIQGLSAVTKDEPGITAALLRDLAQKSIDSNPNPPSGQSALAARLNNLAQITVQIQFKLNSAIIEPSSYQALGSIADAIHHPILRGYRFLVVGNTDATGTRAYNLKLSQERADAIVTALTTTFGVLPARLEAVGLGQEALQNPAKPDDPINRRVQIYNIGHILP